MNVPRITQEVDVGGTPHTVVFNRVNDQTTFESIKVGGVEMLGLYKDLFLISSGGLVPLVTMLAERLESPNDH